MSLPTAGARWISPSLWPTKGSGAVARATPCVLNLKVIDNTGMNRTDQITVTNDGFGQCLMT